ncbi:protein tfg-1-like [Lolium rigidum]|uniref:protein tfg-1-like n=1 Tax=Lolium rigidum TaxID=89674 RepID=UPI001F5C3FF7|nr:protein tfg-1-like [Lolium rigidum]
MNTSQFMDKQILGLAASASPSLPGGGGSGGAELLDLMGPDPQEEGEDRLLRRRHHSSNGAAADVMPSYDFQPIRATAAAPAPAAAPASAWGSLDSSSRAASASSPYNLKTAGILENRVHNNVNHEEDRSNFGLVTIADIDRTMKKYSDNLLHALDGVSSRLSQLEGRTHHLENSVDEFKLTIGNYNGSTDGKLRQLENMLREVQAGVQIMRDKQEIVETQLHLAKLQPAKTETQSSENSGVGQADSRQQSVAQSQHQVLTPSQPQAFPALPAPNAPPPPPTYQSQPPAQFPGHAPHSQMPSAPVPSVPALPQDPYYTPSAQPTEAIHQQYQAPPVSQPQAPPAPQQHYQAPPVSQPPVPPAQQQQYQAPPAPQPQAPPAPQQQYQAPPVPQPQAPPAPPQQYQPPSQFPQYSQQPQSANVNPSSAPPAPQQTEYGPSHNYPPNVHPPSPYMPPPTESAPPFYGQNPSMYEPPAVRPNSGPPPSYGSTGYGPQGGNSFSESYGYTGSPSYRGNAGMKPTPFAPSGPSSGGSSGNYGSRLPTARILPQAEPVSSTPAGPTGNRVALDDVVEKVATMGFSREQVRATVRRLTENGQNVDLNVVLDKLMNG